MSAIQIDDMPFKVICEADVDIANVSNLTKIYAVQYDTGRLVKLRLFNNGVAWSAPTENCLAVVTYKKSDNVSGLYDVTEAGYRAVTVDTINKNVITVALDGNMVTTAGEVTAGVTFYDTSTDAKIFISTFPFIVDVQRASVTTANMTNNPSYYVLADNITRILQAQNSLLGLTVSSTNSNASVVLEGGPTTEPPTPYKFKFTLLPGPVSNPTGTTYEYGNSTSSSELPASWTNTPNITAQTYFWVKSKVAWDNGQVMPIYSANYISPGNVGSVNGLTGAVVDRVLVSFPSLSPGNGAVMSDLHAVFYNSAITEDFVVIASQLSDPGAQRNNWRISVANGSVTVEGKICGTTSLDLILAKSVVLSQEAN